MLPLAPMKQYERAIVRARNRVEVADLDNAIDDLIAVLIGRLTRREHKEYQASRIVGLLNAIPTDIVDRRATLLGIDIKQIAAPDILTLEELAELVIIMREIAGWLWECRAAGETALSFHALILVAERQAELARDRFVAQYQREPTVDDVPKDLMPLVKAQRIKRLADRTHTLMPPANVRGSDHE